ncbi:MAG: hypothetical protein V1779_04905 [bacterium]
MKFLKIFLACIITLIFFNSNNAKACTSTTITMTVGNCDWIVELCVDCTIGPAPSTLSVNGYRLSNPSCIPTLTPLQVLAQIESQVMTYDFIYTYLCDPIQNPPPCSTLNPLHWRINHWVCWQMEWYYYFGQYHLVYHPCDYDNYCYEDCDFCWEPLPPPNGAIIKLCLTPVMVGSVWCTYEGWQVDIPQQGNGNKSECYIYHTPCNP